AVTDPESMFFGGGHKPGSRKAGSRNHEKTKFKKRSSTVRFRLFLISCFRDSLLILDYSRPRSSENSNSWANRQPASHLSSPWGVTRITCTGRNKVKRVIGFRNWHSRTVPGSSFRLQTKATPWVEMSFPWLHHPPAA